MLITIAVIISYDNYWLICSVHVSCSNTISHTSNVYCIFIWPQVCSGFG